MKTCTICGLESIEEDFPIDGVRRADGGPRRRSSCRKCTNARNRATKALREPTPCPPDKHGTNSGYAGYGCRCEACCAAGTAAHLLRKYGLTQDSVDELFAAQGYRCATCNRSELPPGARWCVDHDHACCPNNKTCGSCVRGILCSLCNQGIGQLQDDPNILLAAAAYLVKSRDTAKEKR